MFTRKLHNSDPSRATKNSNPKYPKHRIADYGYGRNGVKVVQLLKDGPVHSVLEYNVRVHMRLSSHKEYYEADNSEIIGSDVMETTVYIHAQKYGLRTPEEFALSLTQYFLDTYEKAIESNVIIEVMGWDRLGEHENQAYYKNKSHNHTFLRNINGRRRCEVVRKRGDPIPLLIGGIREFRIIKSARATFVGYAKGQLYTEGENVDRILSAEINADWEYQSMESIDFKTHWYKVRDLIIQSFAGHPADPDDQPIITSVQYFAYTAEHIILDAMPEISSVLFDLKNIPQLPYDFSRFPDFEPKADVVIVRPQDEPHSLAYIRTDRLDSKL